MFHQFSKAQVMLGLTFAAAGWGVATVITKSVLSEIPPLTLLVVQLTASVIVLAVILAAHRTPFRLTRNLLPIGVLGWLNPGLAYTLSLFGLQLTTASLSTLLWATEPILILCLASLFLREKLTAWVSGLSALALLGVLLAVRVEVAAQNINSLVGNGLILAGVLCCAFYSVFTRRIAIDADPLVVVAVQQAFALVWALALWPLEIQAGGLSLLTNIRLETWLWAALSGVMYYALASWLYVIGLVNLPASQAGVFINLTPVFGLAVAYLALGETLTPLQWLGAALILLAVFGILVNPKQGFRKAA